MGANSKIEWCHHTFNPWIGCTKVSEGCKNCYAEALMDKRWGKVKWGPGGTRQRTSVANWNEPLKWDRAAAKAGERHRVFCASLADVFEGRPELDEWFVDLMLLIDSTPNLDWLLLTKRPENIPLLLPSSFQNYPRKNLWLGTSVENQEQADIRVPLLLACKYAAVRFLSMEPLLGEIHFRNDPPWLKCDEPTCECRGLPTIDWVIVGGESGQGARPCETAWATSIVFDCARANVPCFVKQLGAMPYVNDWEGVSIPLRLKDKKGGDIDEFPDELKVREWPSLPLDAAKEGRCQK